MRFLKALLASIFLAVTFARPGPALAEPETGWWWNPAESGRGFFIEIHENFAFIGAYVYADDGHADWIVSQGNMASPTSYSGRMLSLAGGQTLLGDYRAPGAPSDVGAMSIDFSDDTHAVITWPGGKVPIERLTFDAGTAPLPIGTGWWWNETESGSGWSVEVQGSTLFAVGYMYDETGRPVWYLSAGSMKSNTSYEGALLQFANGQPVVGAYRAPSPPKTIGRLTLDFSGPNDALMTLSDAPTAHRLQIKKGKAKPQKKFFRPPPPRFVPSELHGNWDLDAVHVVSGAIADAEEKIALRDTLAAFSEATQNGESVTYRKFLSKPTLASIYTTTKPRIGSCGGSGGGFALMSETASTLTLTPDGKFHLKIVGKIPYTLTLLCTVDGYGTLPPLIEPHEFEVDIRSDDYSYDFDSRTNKWHFWGHASYNWTGFAGVTITGLAFFNFSGLGPRSP